VLRLFFLEGEEREYLRVGIWGKGSGGSSREIVFGRGLGKPVHGGARPRPDLEGSRFPGPEGAPAAGQGKEDGKGVPLAGNGLSLEKGALFRRFAWAGRDRTSATSSIKQGVLYCRSHSFIGGRGGWAEQLKDYHVKVRAHSLTEGV